MFRSKRSSLVKRLWKYRINDETKGSSQRDTSTSPPQPDSTASFQEDTDFKSVTNSFFKRLKEDQLETLVQAMESRGGEVTPCVPVTKSYLRIGRLMVSPYVLCCRVFRWPDLKSDTEMKRLPSCMRQNEEKEAVICCNPYHWSLVVKIDEPPVHSQRNVDGDKNEDGYPKILEPTMDTGHRLCGHEDDLSGQSTEYDCTLWCTVAYWELRERVGRLFSVTDPSVHIFQQLPHGDGMCLRLFQKPTNVEVVKRTREKIGFGIILSREAAHRREASMIAAHDVVEDGTGVSPEISVSPLSSQLCLSSSPFLSPPQEERGDTECGLKSHSVFSSTSISQMPALPSGVHRTDVDFIGGVVSDINAGCDEKDVIGHRYDDGSDQPSCHQHGHQQHGTDSMHDSYLYVESMDYTQDLGTSPPYFQQSHHLGLHPQSRSPSCLSSSSFSSSPPSSPPMYFSSDSSFNDLHYSNTNCGSSGDTNATTHLNNSKTNNHHHHSNNHHHSNISTSSCIKRFNAVSSTDNKYVRNMTSPILTPSTVTQTTNVTTSSGLSSCLPANQGEVWAYNASDFPIFVNSPTLDDPQSPRSLVVKKVPPGYSIKIYDYARAELLERTDARSVLLKDGPFDPCCVRISLAKGWGPSYSRQFITSCPCWLEVLLGARRHSSAS